MIIARIWHGLVTREKGDDYLELMRTVALRDYADAPGNIAAHCMRSRQDDGDHFIMFSVWENEGAIARFAGPDISAARYYPFDDSFLIEKEPKVRHYELY